MISRSFSKGYYFFISYYFLMRRSGDIAVNSHELKADRQQLSSRGAGYAAQPAAVTERSGGSETAWACSFKWNARKSLCDAQGWNRYLD